MIEETAMEMGVPQVIVHSHSTGIDFAAKEDRDRLLAVHEEYKRQFHMGMATDVCACSRLAGEWLYSAAVPKSLIHILPNAVDVRKYHFNPEKRACTRRKLGIDDRIVVGNIGRYSYQKNQEFLIRSFAKAYQRNKKLFLLLIGQGELKVYLKNLIKQLGIENNAVCMDWQERVEDYLQAMDIFCLPSHFEGLSICAVEAQAAGLKCYVSDTLSEETAVTDLVEFLPLQEEQWEHVLTEARISADREQMDAQIARQGYDIRTAADNLMNLYGNNV